MNNYERKMEANASGDSDYRNYNYYINTSL